MAGGSQRRKECGTWNKGGEGTRGQGAQGETVYFGLKETLGSRRKREAWRDKQREGRGYENVENGRKLKSLKCWNMGEVRVAPLLIAPWFDVPARAKSSSGGGR